MPDVECTQPAKVDFKGLIVGSPPCANRNNHARGRAWYEANLIVRP